MFFNCHKNFSRRIIFLFFIFVLIFFIPQNLQAEKKLTVKDIPDNADFWSQYPADVLADALVERMDDEELLSQVLMFGWTGSTPTELLIRWVRDRGLGSVKIFGWNTDDINMVSKSVKLLQELSQSRTKKIPLFVATDQEGGWIRHVKGQTSDTPGNLAIGASGYTMDAYLSGYYINREIKTLGINMNFAPSIDIYSNVNSTVIGPRSFGNDPNVVGAMGAAFAAGSMAAGVIPTAKHFPGHGDTALDSHGKLPQINIDLKTLNERELVPFKMLIQQNVSAIMSGHLSFPKIRGNNEPASLSKFFLTDILRNQLGYEGLIITDDMMMNGATIYAGTLHNAVRLAIEAGNDIVISSSTPTFGEALWTRNFALMQTDSVFRQQVKKAARRVVYHKLKYYQNPDYAPLYPDEKMIKENIPDKDGELFFTEQACRSISVIKQGDFPLTAEKAGKVLIAGPFISYFNEGRKRFPGASTYHYNYELAADKSNYETWNAESLTAVARNYDTIILCVFNEHSMSIAERLRWMGKRVVIMNILSPLPVLNNDWADTVICGFSYSKYSFAAMFAALAGEIQINGQLPLEY